MILPLAETIPAVTVCSRPKGEPMATTQEPTGAFLEDPNFNGLSPFASIFINARSVTGSTPIIRASYSWSSWRITLTWSASLITWLLVTMYPALSMIKPEPRLLSVRFLGILLKGLKNSSMPGWLPKGDPKKCRKTRPPPLIVFTVCILTTPGLACCASCEKFAGIIRGCAPDSAGKAKRPKNIRHAVIILICRSTGLIFIPPLKTIILLYFIRLLCGHIQKIKHKDNF